MYLFRSSLCWFETDSESIVVSIAERANLKREIDAVPAMHAGAEKDERVVPTSEELEDELRDDGSWYMGKAREEFHRRRMGEARREEEEDLVQVCLHACRADCFVWANVCQVGKGQAKC